MLIIDKKQLLAAASALLFCSLSTTAIAQEEEAAPSTDGRPLMEGAYIAPMGSFLITDAPKTDEGYGGVLAGGYRNGSYAFEFKAVYHSISSDERSRAKQMGGSVGYLLFPFESMPNVFGIAELGGLSVLDYPALDRSRPSKTTQNIDVVTAGIGAGLIVPLSIGQYEYGIRAEALYRYAHRDTDVTPGGDIVAPKNFDDILINVGLQLPFGRKPAPAAPVPVAVVPTASICADQLDNDGDGKIDFPNDGGCASADDNDETDPPACSDGKDNDGDGQIDFPADKGCTAADDTDETDLCRTPAAGEKVSLTGCASGDVIVLRGVNFEFDKARLTPDAKAILDGVADELTANPGIRFELGGHTDAKGSDEYNQRLSENRAKAVMAYLASKNISEDRMSAAGYGEAQPTADNETEEGRELNRRVELKVTGSAAGDAAVAPATEAAAPADAAPVAEAAPAAEAASAEAVPADATTEPTP